MQLRFLKKILKMRWYERHAARSRYNSCWFCIFYKWHLAAFVRKQRSFLHANTVLVKIGLAAKLSAAPPEKHLQQAAWVIRHKHVRQEAGSFTLNTMRHAWLLIISRLSRGLCSSHAWACPHYTHRRPGHQNSAAVAPVVKVTTDCGQSHSLEGNLPVLATQSLK